MCVVYTFYLLLYSISRKLQKQSRLRYLKHTGETGKHEFSEMPVLLKLITSLESRVLINKQSGISEQGTSVRESVFHFFLSSVVNF